MRKVLAIIVLLTVGLMVWPVQGQNTLSWPEDCSTDTMKSVVSNVKGVVDEINTQLQGTATIENPSAMYDSFGSMSVYLGALKAQCDGLVFSGKSPKVIGPVQIPAGIYRLTATTDGYMILDLSAANGECGGGTRTPLESNLFILTKGQASDGAETVFSSKDCTALLEVSNTQGEWKLSFERVS